MKKIIAGLSLFLFLVLAVVSCKKDHPQEQTDPTPTVQNISGSYTIAKITVKNIASGLEEQQAYPDCKKDDELHFNSNMIFNYVDAGTACTSPGDWNGVWALPTSSILEIDGSPSAIIKFNGTNLNLSTYYDDENSLITYLVKK